MWALLSLLPTLTLASLADVPARFELDDEAVCARLQSMLESDRRSHELERGAHGGCTYALAVHQPQADDLLRPLDLALGHTEAQHQETVAMYQALHWSERAQRATPARLAALQADVAAENEGSGFCDCTAASLVVRGDWVALRREQANPSCRPSEGGYQRPAYCLGLPTRDLRPVLLVLGGLTALGLLGGAAWWRSRRA